MSTEILISSLVAVVVILIILLFFVLNRNFSKMNEIFSLNNKMAQLRAELLIEHEKNKVLERKVASLQRAACKSTKSTHLSANLTQEEINLLLNNKNDIII